MTTNKTQPRTDAVEVRYAQLVTVAAQRPLTYAEQELLSMFGHWLQRTQLQIDADIARAKTNLSEAAR